MSTKVEVKDKDKGWKEFFERLKEAGDARVKVGVLADTEKGSAKEGTLTVAEIAGIQEFGTEDGRIPSRSFIRSTFDEKKEELHELGVKLFEKVIDGKMTGAQAVAVMGNKLASDTKKKITTTEIPPPNAESTIKQKGSSHPLIDTGRMVNAITYQVEGGESHKSSKSEKGGKE